MWDGSPMQIQKLNVFKHQRTLQHIPNSGWKSNADSTLDRIQESEKC
jgi:hypothetical protein